MFYEKKLFLKISQYTQESCRPATLFKKTPTQMFSSAYCDFFRNTYFEVNMLKAASDFLKQLQRWAAASELTALLTLSRRRSLSYRNQSIDLRSKSMGWFLCDNGLRHERVKFRYLITVYEQVSYSQFNQNLSICVSLAKGWFCYIKSSIKIWQLIIISKYWFMWNKRLD